MVIVSGHWRTMVSTTSWEETDSGRKAPSFWIRVLGFEVGQEEDDFRNGEEVTWLWSARTIMLRCGFWSDESLSPAARGASVHTTLLICSLSLGS